MLIIRFCARSRIAHAIFYAFMAFIVIFGLDLLWHYGARWEWFWERLARDLLEATAVGIIAARLAHLREQGILRRQRAARYLNHHVRNALFHIHAAELMEAQHQSAALRQASQRICTVLEQFSRDEDIAIDEEEPDKVTTAA